MQCYLDNSATTKPSESVVKAMCASMREGFFNPASLYKPAMLAEKQMNACRESIALRLHTFSDRVLFTSGGTESDNLAILGGLAALHGSGRVLFSAGEHPAVRAACESVSASYHVCEIPYDKTGLIDLNAAQELITPDTRMICIMQVNNETGAVQPLESVARLRNSLAPDALLHVDGVQGFLRVPIDLNQIGIDSYALSAHKINGPKGIGALAIGTRMRVLPRMFGGGQEKGLRSGTENTPGIAGMHTAIETYLSTSNMRVLKLCLLDRLITGIPAIHINGPDPANEASAPHILNVSLLGVRAEAMLHALEIEGVYVGTGSACSSKKAMISPTLRAMHTSPEQAESAIRFSFCTSNTLEEIEYAADAVNRNYATLQRYKRR